MQATRSWLRYAIPRACDFGLQLVTGQALGGRLGESYTVSCFWKCFLLIYGSGDMDDGTENAVQICFNKEQQLVPCSEDEKKILLSKDF